MANETRDFGTRKIDDLGRIILPKEINDGQKGRPLRGSPEIKTPCR